MSVADHSGAGVGGSEPPAGAIVSSALRICREHWKPLAVYGVIAGVPVAALDAAVALDRGVDPFANPLTANPSATGGQSPGASVLALVLYAVASAATVHTVAAARDGRRVGWQEGLSTGVRRLGGVLAVSIIVLVLVLLGLLALVLPGIWIAVALALATPALILERLTALAAIRRSFTMVQGHWWKTAAVAALSVLVVLAAIIAISIPAGVLAAATEDPPLRAVIAGVVNALSTALLVPLTLGPMTVLFLERREAGDASAESEEGGRYRGFAPPVAPDRVLEPESSGAPGGPGALPDGERPPQSPQSAPPREPPSASPPPPAN